MTKLTALFAPLVLGFANPLPAAVSYATLGIAGKTNAFIFGDAVTTEKAGFAEGPIVVGGKWSGNEYADAWNKIQDAAQLTEEEVKALEAGDMKAEEVVKRVEERLAKARENAASIGLSTIVTAEDFAKARAYSRMSEATQARLATGMKINSAKDDAAGLEIQKALEAAPATAEEAAKAAEVDAQKIEEAKKRGEIYKPGLDLAPTIKNLKSLSSDLFTFDSVKLDVGDKGPENVVVDLGENTANKGNLKVYTIDSSLLSSTTTLSFKGGSGEDTIVINVTGDAINWGWTVNPEEKTGYNNILWNFAGKEVDMKGQSFGGTLLAPNATVNQESSTINGTLIANNWNASGDSKLTSHPFTGKIPCAVAAPEPAGLLTMSGFLGLALGSRRRQSDRL